MAAAFSFRMPFVALWARCIRTWHYNGDRQLLAEMDDHLLDDLGLRRGDVTLGLPFRSPEPCMRPDRGFRRRGSLSVRDWTFKLYAPAGDHLGLRREDDARAARAIGAVTAEPGPAPTAGFAILRPGSHGALGLASWWWADRALHCHRMDIPPAGRPSRSATTILEMAEIGLMDRECAAWRRHVLEATRPDLTAYVSEDCA